MLKKLFLTAALAVLGIGGAGTEIRAEYNRRTAIVEAVQKTRQGIVTVKVERRGSWGRKEVVGSGVLVDERGYLITNCHVVAAADTVRVILADGVELPAQVHLQDTHHDLAILRVTSKKKLPALTFGPGSDLMVGETVIAVGHPFGYTNTVSTGIISALGREITMPSGEVLGNLIQTCASINPGNSGGPLLNVNGELIGINVALREGAQNIAFALNADTVQALLSQHLSALKVAGVGHGLTCREQVAEHGQMRQKVVVDQIEINSPAGKAGMQPGDVILRLGERTLTNRFDLERALWSSKPGDRVVAVVLREGMESRIALTLAPLLAQKADTPRIVAPAAAVSQTRTRPTSSR
jgi:serine protease Do